MFECAIQIDPKDDVAHYRLVNLNRNKGNVYDAKEQIDLYLNTSRSKTKWK